MLQYSSGINARISASRSQISLKGNGLHTPGAGTRLHTSPEQGADFIANETIQYATGLLSVEEVFVDVTRSFDGFLYGPFGDFVEHGAAWILQSQCIFQGPCNKLAFTVRVWCQVHFISAPGGGFQFVYQFIFLFDDFILWGKALARIDAQALFGQVNNVSH